MSIFYVFQGKTYSEERDGGFVWSPQLDKAGHKNIGYTTMTKVHKDDFILHHANGKLVAISIAKENCREANKPPILSTADIEQLWGDNDTHGYRVDTIYFEFDIPINMKNYTEWLKKNYVKESAFNKNGGSKQQYMCCLADKHAMFLLKEAIKLQKSEEVIHNLKCALSSIERLQ